MNPDGTFAGGPSDWELNTAPIEPGNVPQPSVPPAWSPDMQNQPEMPPQAPGAPPTEVSVISELLRTVSLLGQDAAHTRAVLSQQTETLRLLQTQLYQSSQDSAELTRRVADHAASAFRTFYSANSGGNAAVPGSTRAGTVKVREPRMFSGKADDVKPFVREVKACIQLQRSAFLMDEDKTLYFSLYLKSGAAESWYNAVRINKPALLTDFDTFVRAFVKRFQTTDLAAKYLAKIEALRQTVAELGSTRPVMCY
ncbi:hypothetical protein C8Q77DRAFT_1157105 [Trametes polyzona]|nr:hypothetical protein C8Q77DRAFT_1157105 [Trametes polyzona]